MGSIRRVHDTLNNMGRTEDLETTTEALATGTGTEKLQDSATEAERLARHAALGEVDEYDLAAAGLIAEGATELPDEPYDDQVDSYNENHPEIGEDHEVPQVIEDGETTYLR